MYKGQTELQKVAIEMGALTVQDGKTYSTANEIGEWEASFEDENTEQHAHIMMYNETTRKSQGFEAHQITELQDTFPQFFED